MGLDMSNAERVRLQITAWRFQCAAPRQHLLHRCHAHSEGMDYNTKPQPREKQALHQSKT